MPGQLVVATTLLLISATLLAIVGAIAWRYHPAPSARLTAVTIWLASAWSVTYAGEISALNFPLKLIFAKAEYISIVAIPSVWLAVVLQYTDRDRWLRGWVLVLAVVEPLLTLAFVWTNGLHGLVWDTVSLNAKGAFPSLAVTYAPWFWVHNVYSQVLIGAGILLLIREAQASTRLSREQISAVLISIIAPVAGNLMYVTRLSPFGDLDLTVYAFLITGPALLWGLLHSQFLDLAPVARATVVESMADGFLVLSPNDRIIDVNAATLHLLKKTSGEVQGKPVTALFNLQLPTLHTESVGYHEPLGEMTLGEGEAERTFEARVSLLQDRSGRLRGRVVLLSDVTYKKRSEVALEDVIRRKDIAYEQALIYSNELNQEIRARKSAEEALRGLSHKLEQVQEAERRHIARELHDEIGQALTGLRFVLESNQDKSPSLNEGMQIINDLIQQVHDLSLTLRPTMLDDLGLLPALLWYIERYSSQRGIAVNFKHRGLDRRFATDVETAVYRIVQEGLTNVSKYAKVNSVDVSIWTTETTLEVQIEDSGTGFDVARALTPPNSSGLVGMKERVNLLGGTFTIDSAPGEGTRLTAQLPLHRVASEVRT